MPFVEIRKWGQRAVEAFGGLLFSSLFVVFIIQVVARFVFDKPLPWTDELAVVLYIWVILWAAAFMVPEREHVVFDLVYHCAPPGGRRAMRIVGHLMLGGLAALGLPASLDYIRFMAREGTPVLGVPFMWVFLPFALLLISLIVRAIWQIVAIVREIQGDER